MSHGLVAQTLSTIIQEIETVLEEYPENPYQRAFSLPELHQKLIDHVLNNVPSYNIVDGAHKPPNNPQARHFSFLQRRLRTEMIIRGSILHILRENADWLSHQSLES